MEYLFTFLEGFASFISPCLLPMLPIYISYFMGEQESDNKKTIINSIGFVIGFTIIFLLLAVFASTLGTFISAYLHYIKFVFGVIIILLGLNYMEILKFKFLNNSKGIKMDIKNLNFFKSMLFGILFSISWTPCVGTFLGSALLIIAKGSNLLKGIILMLLYSVGLGIPFVISVALMEKLKNIFNFIKRNYGIVKKISGIVLIIMGIYIMF